MQASNSRARAHSIFVAACIASTATLDAGCTYTRPHVTVADPRIYTVSNLVQVKQWDSVSTAKDMKRLFGYTSTPTASSSKPADTTPGKPCPVLSAVSRWLHVHGLRRAPNPLASPGAPSKSTDMLIDTLARSTQRQTEFNQLIALHFVAQAAKHGQTEGQLADYVKTLDALNNSSNAAGAIEDSPFDLIDRAEDIYLTFYLKMLRSTFDSRTSRVGNRMLETIGTPPPRPDATDVTDACVAAQKLSEYRELFACKVKDFEDAVFPIEICEAPRLLFVVFQACVNPGNGANRATDIRLTIEPMQEDDLACEHGEHAKEIVSRVYAAWSEAMNGPCQAPVRVLRLVPSRTYDIDTQHLTASDVRALQVAFGSDSGAKASLDGLAALVEKRKFLTRLSKMACFVDGGAGRFGWTFYPSNISLEARTIPEQLTDFFLYGFAQRPEANVRARLEAGGRDCAVVLHVPAALRRIRLRVESYSWKMPPEWVTIPEATESVGKNLVVDLPPFDISEIIDQGRWRSPER